MPRSQKEITKARNQSQVFWSTQIDSHVVVLSGYSIISALFTFQTEHQSKMAMAAKACSPLLIRAMAAQKPTPAATKTVASKKGTTSGQSVKLLTRVEQLRLLTKAEKAGLLSAAEKAGFSLSTIERLGLLSKAEEFGVLSAATDPGTASGLLSLSLALLALGPVCVFLVPEDYPWEIGLQVVVALLAVVGGSAAFAASNLVSTLQKSS